MFGRVVFFVSRIERPRGLHVHGWRLIYSMGDLLTTLASDRLAMWDRRWRRQASVFCRDRGLLSAV